MASPFLSGLGSAANVLGAPVRAAENAAGAAGKAIGRGYDAYRAYQAQPYPTHLDLRDPRQLLLTALMAGGTGGMRTVEPRGPVSDPFDSAAKSMIADRERQALIRQMHGSQGISAGYTQPPLTAVQKMFMAQLGGKISARELDNPQVASRVTPWITENQVAHNADLHSIASLLGYTTGRPGDDLLNSFAGTGLTQRQIGNILGTGQEPEGPGPAFADRLSKSALPGNVDTWFPLFQRNASPNFRFSLQGQGRARNSLTEYMANLMRGYGRDTGPPAGPPNSPNGPLR